MGSLWLLPSTRSPNPVAVPHRKEDADVVLGVGMMRVFLPRGDPRLRGWGERTRTCKCHFQKTIEMSGEFSLNYEAFGGRDFSRASC